MKIRCRYCRRLIRVTGTRASTPRLVKHPLPAELCDFEGIPHGTPCYGSLISLRVHNRPRRQGVPA